MLQHELREKLDRLFKKVEAAHQETIIDSQGEDEEWAIWHANYLAEPLSNLLQAKLTRSRIIFCLLTASYEYEVTRLTVLKSDFYVDFFIQHFAKSIEPSIDQLALYTSPSCPYCYLVSQAIAKLDIDVELLDVSQNREHYQTLVEARGRGTVPVLIITQPDGEVRLLPESRDIVDYLNKTYG